VFAEGYFSTPGTNAARRVANGTAALTIKGVTAKNAVRLSR